MATDKFGEPDRRQVQQEGALLVQAVRVKLVTSAVGPTGVPVEIHGPMSVE
ncbi:MAG: hypothetical protein ACM3ZA_13350 [Bacillota bacterium]